MSSQGSYEEKSEAEKISFDVVVVCHVKRESKEVVSSFSKRGSRDLTCRLATSDGCLSEHLKSILTEKGGNEQD